MQFRFFHIPAIDAPKHEEELNQFLRQHRVLRVVRKFVPDQANSFWTVSVTYAGEDASQKRPSNHKQVDYRELLPPEEFIVFAKLRKLRNSMAQLDGVPPFALFNNDHLVTMVQSRVTTEAALGAIPGVGKIRVSKYGKPFLKILAEAFPKEPAPKEEKEPPDETKFHLE